MSRYIGMFRLYPKPGSSEDGFIVNDKNVEILEQTDTPMLTLYTCTPKRTALKRLVYRAQLLDK